MSPVTCTKPFLVLRRLQRLLLQPRVVSDEEAVALAAFEAVTDTFLCETGNEKVGFTGQSEHGQKGCKVDAGVV